MARHAIQRVLARAVALRALALVMLPAPAAAQSASSGPIVERHELTTEQWRQDLRALADGLRRRHRNLHHTTPATTFDSAVASLSRRLPSLRRHQVIMEMARITALAGDRHTNIDPTRDSVIGFRTLPISLFLFKDGLFIRAARAPHSSLPGTRVTRIGDATAEQAVARVRPYIGRDNDMGARFTAPLLLAMPEVLHALGLAPGADSARFEIEAGEKRRTVWLRAAGPARPLAPDTDDSWRRRAEWIDARDAGDGGPEPLWLRNEPDSVAWWYTGIPGTRTLYAQVNALRDGPKSTFEEFARRLLARIDSGPTDRLVLDVRLSRGGDGTLLRPLVRGLLRRPVSDRGRLVVLVGRGTASAAQLLIDDLEEFSDAVFVGEPTGSRGNRYGDARTLALPNSRITVHVSSQYWQDWAPTDTRQWTAPEVAAEMTMADYRTNRDPAMEAALAYVPRPPLVSDLRVLLSGGDTLGARMRLRLYRDDPAHAFVDVRRRVDSVAAWFHARKDLARATSALELAASEFPDSAPALVSLADLYRAGGRGDLARTRLTRALQLDPRNEIASTMLKELGPP